MWMEEIRKRSNWALEGIFGCVVTIVVTVILYIALLFGCRMMWALYSETHVGNTWILSHSYEADLIVWILDSDFIHLAIFLLSTFVITSLPLLVYARILMIYRFLYESQSLLYRLILCGGPLVYFAAIPTSIELEIEVYEAAILLVLPGLAITPSLLNMMKRIIPEPPEVVGLFKQWRHNKLEPPSSREDNFE